MIFNLLMKTIGSYSIKHLEKRDAFLLNNFLAIIQIKECRFYWLYSGFQNYNLSYK